MFAFADTCNFGNMLDEILRDRFVLGFRSQEAIAKIATDPSDARNPLTYQRAIDIALGLEVANPTKQCSTRVIYANYSRIASRYSVTTHGF